MTRFTPLARAVACAALLATVGACTDSQGGAQDSPYAQDGDTGAAAPATETNVTPMQAPDSTAGVARSTGTGGSAGVKNNQGAKGSDIAQPSGQTPRP